MNSLKKDHMVDQYVIQNLTWSGVYLIITLLNDTFQKVLTLVPLTATVPEVYVTTMINILTHMALWRRLWIIWIVSKSRVIWGRMLNIFLLQFWFSIIALIFPDSLSPIVLATSLVSLMVFLIINFVFGWLISTKRLRSLSENFLCETWMSYGLRISLLFSSLYKRLHKTG